MKDCDQIVSFDVDMDDLINEVEREVDSTTDDDPDSPVKPPPAKRTKVKGSAASKLESAQKRAEEIFASLNNGKK